MFDYSTFAKEIYVQLSASERERYSSELIEHIVFLFHEMAHEYEQSIFEKVHHVDLFFRDGFENYVDTAVICAYIKSELEKDSFSIEDAFLGRLIESIKQQKRRLESQVH
jgi:hypothetical protein